MSGFYVEAGYNVLKFVSSTKTELIPFARFESYNTHFSTTGNLAQNKAYNNNEITTGLTYNLSSG